MSRPSTTLHLGDTAPEFELRDAASGATRALSDLLTNRRGLLLVFHRGMW
jgi:peroxiredoxin